MSEVLERAKATAQEGRRKVYIAIKLSLLEGLIAEIEILQHKVDALSQEHPAHKLRPVRDGLS